MGRDGPRTWRRLRRLVRYCGEFARNRSVRRSGEASVIRRRGQPGRLAKRRRERAGLAEADRQSDIGHRWLWLGQQHLGPLDPAIVVISVRRQSEGLLERPTEVV